MLEEMTLFNTPPFSNSIFTFEPGLPAEVHVIVWAVTLIQLSPPFGEVTVNVPVVTMAKLASLESMMAVLVVLVILIV